MSPQPQGRARLPPDRTGEQEGQPQVGKAGPLPCVSQHLPATGATTMRCPGAAWPLQALPGVGGQLWATGTESSCAGPSPQTDTGLGFTLCRGPPLPSDPSGSRSSQGREAGSSLRGHGARLLRDGPRPLRTGAPGCWGYELGTTRPSQPPWTTDFRYPNVQAGTLGGSGREQC